MQTPSSPVRFGVFELDLRTGELRKKGLKIRLEGQPIQILALLLERPGELITQDDIRAKLWPDGTVVEFEHSIKTAMRKLRQALGDEAETPRYIETLPRRGYRFIAPVNSAGVLGEPSPRPRPSPSGKELAGESVAVAERGSDLGTPPLATPWGLRTTAMLAMLVVGLAVGWLVWSRSRPLPEITQRRLTSNSTEIPVLSGAISPDGKYVAYSDSGGLHLKLLQTGELRTLPKPSWFPSDGVWNVASWFPDGAQLLTNLVQPGGHSSIWAVSVMGENPRQLRDDAKAWAVSPDSLRIAFTVGAPDYRHEIWTMSGGGGNLQKVLAMGGDESIVDIQWSPEGGRIAYGSARATPDEAEVTIRTIDLNGGKPTLLVPQPLVVSLPILWWRIDRGLFSWLPGGRLVYSRFDTPPPIWGIGDSNLWQLPVDARSGAPSGKPVQVTRWGGD